jgi:hypothetical protein
MARKRREGREDVTHPATFTGQRERGFLWDPYPIGPNAKRAQDALDERRVSALKFELHDAQLKQKQARLAKQIRDTRDATSRLMA